MHTRCISSHYPAFASSWFPPDKTRLLLVICRSKDSFLYRFYLRRNHISLAFRTRLIAMVFYYRGNLNANFNCPFFTGMTLLAQHGDMNGDVFFLPPRSTSHIDSGTGAAGYVVILEKNKSS